MVEAMREAYGKALLGTLERPTAERVREAAPALSHLSRFGLTAPRRGLSNALALALVHSSYYFENKKAVPGITKAMLDALNRLGGAFLQKAAAAETYRNSTNPTSGSMSKDVATIASSVPAWAAEQKWIRQSAALSVGLSREELPAKVTALLFRQLLGVLCLAGEEEVARKLVSDLITTQLQGAAGDVSDPKKLLQEHLGFNAVTYEFRREGPDHNTIFHAVAADSRRRRGEGTGRSKKAAAHQASLDFLRKHIPKALSARRETAAPRLPALEIPFPEVHVKTVSRLQELFTLPDQARPLLSQALIHASWTYENQAMTARYRQRDYQVLAFLGSHVLVYEYFLATARHLAVDPPEEFPFGHVPNDIFDSAFRQAGLAPGLLLGTGQGSMGIPVEMGSDAFQAVLGAVSVAGGFPDTLANQWPTEWRALWQLIVPKAPLPIDPTSRLERAASTMKLQLRHEYRESGPDHQRRYAATVIFDSVALGLSTRMEGTAAVGKTPAKHQVSRLVLNVLDRLADHSPARSFDSADERDRSLARFLLAQQAFVLAMSPVPPQRWISQRLFGLHLVSDSAALLTWAVGVDELLGLDVALQPGGHLREAFRSAVDTIADADRALDTALAQAMDAIEQFQDPVSVDPAFLQHLVQLCDVYRCLGTDDRDISLSELVDDWRILHRDRLKTAAQWPGVRISARERATSDAALSAVTAAGHEASAEVLGVSPLHLRFRSAQPLSRSSVEGVCALWSKVSRTTSIMPTDHGIDVIVSTTQTPVDPGPITQAVVDALRPSPEPYRAAVADLLHDLKNQLVASRLASSHPAESRTAQLQQQLTASRHLDEAHSLALRVRAATSILRPAGTESVELGGFLRQYAAAVLTRLPANISLSVPEASHPVHVALEARTLNAVLDNLVGNAIEALRKGGAITLAWTADEYEAVVEIADNGPGLPADVAAALASGERVRSTKPGGNGLGLLGVRTLLARVGGQLSAAPAPSGTAWLITLPIAPSTTSESE
ncbi:ATP-binding protein [Streptomyces sp. NBC_00481]|uniref:ATP-binding protein n=1 Tax=Streptomyces sp. NBC_00481 TaxID=2975755 RepID=UPI002DD80FB9|nr:ATP-binding protein [Streptomyces sp. NBC_00481]WRY94741.1 ATP-binding protein [Streptomyces sp. NBC_00481]